MAALQQWHRLAPQLPKSSARLSPAPLLRQENGTSTLSRRSAPSFVLRSRLPRKRDDDDVGLKSSLAGFLRVKRPVVTGGVVPAQQQQQQQQQQQLLLSEWPSSSSSTTCLFSSASTAAVISPSSSTAQSSSSPSFSTSDDVHSGGESFFHSVLKTAGVGRASGSPFPSNLTVVETLEEYDKFSSSSLGPDGNVTDMKLSIAFFSAKFSTSGIVILPAFLELCRSYPQHHFLLVDCDVCPRAAYHAEVEQPPTIVVMAGDDAYRHRIAPIDVADTSDLLQRAKAAIDGFPAALAKAKGGLQSKTAWYTKNISVDNLNVHRTGWPTGTIAN